MNTVNRPGTSIFSLICCKRQSNATASGRTEANGPPTGTEICRIGSSVLPAVSMAPAPILSCFLSALPAQPPKSPCPVNRIALLTGPGPSNSQFWLLRPPSGPGVAYTDSNAVREQLGSWDNRRYDFHYNSESSTRRLNSYRACQQDAVLFTGHGLFGGCDGSADRKVPYSLRAARLIRSCRFLSLLEGHWLRFALKQWRYSASYNKSERKWMYLGD